MTPAFQFDAATHTYTVDGVAVPSVTQCLAEVGLSDYGRCDPAVLEYRKELGTQVHRWAQFYDEGDSDIEAIIGTPLEPYCMAWAKFREEMRFVPSLLEHSGIAESNGCRFGWTIDREGPMVNRYVLDIKTSHEMDRSVPIQLAAYEHALFLQDGIHRRRAAVQLMDDGRFKIHEYSAASDLQIFRAALALTHWKRSN